MSQGCLIACQKRTTGMRKRSAGGSSTTSTKTISAPYSVATSLARLTMTPSPLFPTVTPMATPMPMGA